MNSIHGYHDKNSKVSGLWHIIECVSLSGSSEDTGIEGTEFLLTESGDVDWNVKEGGQNLPLFECQMYELYTYQNLQCYVNRTLIRFVGYKGHIIEFRLDQPVMSEDLMLLTYDGWFMLQCEKLPNSKCVSYQSYSLLSALHDEYFADIKIISKSKKERPCHSIVLEASLPALDWKGVSDPLQPLNGLEDDVLEILLHYLYSSSLPSNMLLSTARKCITSTRHLLDLDDFRKDCEVYGRNTVFRNQFIEIVHAIHQSLERIHQVFSSSAFPSSAPQIIYNLKVVLRHFAVGIVKVIEACLKFEDAGDELSLDEQSELMKYIRIHVPLLLSKVIDVLSAVKTILVSLTPHTLQELTFHLVPETHRAFQTIIYYVKKLRNSLEQIIHASSLSMEKARSPQMLLSNTLRHDLHLRELQKFRILQENLSSLTSSIMYKKTQFDVIGPDGRVIGVARMVELIALELPDLILRLNEILQAIDDLFDWSEFKFVLKGTTSKVRRIIKKLCKHSEIFEDLIKDLVERVNDESFTSALAQLGFVVSSCPERGSVEKNASPPPHSSSPPSASFSASALPTESSERREMEEAFGQVSLSHSSSSASAKEKLKEGAEEKAAGEDFLLPRVFSNAGFKDAKEEESKANFEGGELPEHLHQEALKLNLVKRVCSLPSGHNSKLAASLLSYLESSHLVDMTFLVIPPLDGEDDCSNSSIESLSSETAAKTSSPKTSLECPLSVNEKIHKKLDSALNYTHVRRVRKSFSLDKPSCLSPSNSFSNNANNNDIPPSHCPRKTPLNRGRGPFFKQSLSLDAGSLLFNNGSASVSSAEEAERSNSTKRSLLLSNTSESYDSSTTNEADNVPKENDDSIFESLPYSYTELKPSRLYLSPVKSEAKNGIELKAHRVVIAARCEWFKRALLSGMKESIDRHIEVPGVSHKVFKLFLSFLYGSHVDLSLLQLDEMVDLLVLVDHYGVDSLKSLIEQCLETKVDDESALPLMVVAYHCNATKLKDICLQHCALRRNYEMLNQLPTELRQQLVSTITSLKNWHRHGLEDGLIEFCCDGESPYDGGWDSPTSLDPLIDDESSSLLTGMPDSASSSEESFCLPCSKR